MNKTQFKKAFGNYEMYIGTESISYIRLPLGRCTLRWEKIGRESKLALAFVHRDGVSKMINWRACKEASWILPCPVTGRDGQTWLMGKHIGQYAQW